MRISGMVLLYSLFIGLLSSTTFAQTNCISKIFDPRGGIKCNDRTSGNASSTFGGVTNSSSKKGKSDNPKSTGNSGYFNSQNYFTNKDYYKRTNPTGNPTQQQSEETKTNRTFGSSQFGNNSK